LEPQVLNSLRALRWPSESYSDVIIRLAAYSEEERSIIEVVQRGRDKPLTKEEIYLSLEQARDLGEIDDSTGARLPLRAPLKPLRRGRRSKNGSPGAAVTLRLPPESKGRAVSRSAGSHVIACVG
jgi:hypothetical protein